MALATTNEMTADAVGNVDATALLDSLFSNSQDATVIVGADGTITYATPAMSLVFGFDRTSLVGASVFEFLHPDDVEAAADVFTRRLSYHGSDQGKEVRIRSTSGEWRTVTATASLLPEPRFGACAITLVVADEVGGRELSLRRRLVVADYINRLGGDLMASAGSTAVIERIRRALGDVGLLTGATSAAVYIERLERGQVELVAGWTSETDRLAPTIGRSGRECEGRAVEELLSRHVVVDATADRPGDHRDRCLIEFASTGSGAGLLATPFTSGGRRGTLILVRHGGPAWWDSDSALVRGMANLVARALQTTWVEQLLSLTYQLGPVGFSIRTWDGTFVDCNQRYLDLYQVTREEAATRGLYDVLLPEYCEPVLELQRQMREGELDRFVAEVEVWRGDGTKMWARTNEVPMTVPGTQDRFVLTSVENITETQLQHLELQHAATHDSLTGVANRAAMCSAIEHSAALVGQLPGLLMIDLDDFKLVNDSHGHAVGDHVLRTVAGRIAEVLRGTDVVARLGGDEFAVVAPGLRAADVDGLADRLRRAVSRPIEFAGGTIVQTMSIGVALGQDCDDLADLLVKADRALYAAKDNDRNCHVTFAPQIHDDVLA